jgi:hypothetical protein
VPGHLQFRLPGRRRQLLIKQITLSLVLFYVGVGVSRASAQAIVTHGKFTNVYVYPNSDTMTWEDSFKFSSFSPDQPEKFSRASIDAFTRELMRPVWPSYFDPLFQYTTSIDTPFGPIGKDNIHPPQFFGSGVAPKWCIDKALHSVRYLIGRVLDWGTIRDLANCQAVGGMDPSTQVNLIFSPDITIADVPDSLLTPPNEAPPDMCKKRTNGYHSFGFGVPNFTVLTTSQLCVKNFDGFTELLSHEVVETLSDPGGLGYGDVPRWTHELADLCENEFTVVSGFSLARYKSIFDNNCQPRLDPPPGDVSETWVLGQGTPLQRFTGQVHTLALGVPASRVISDEPVTQAILVIQTGADDLRGGSSSRDNANATLNFVGGQTITTNINQGRKWDNGETHAVTLNLPANPPRVSDITGVTITTNFGGGIGGDNWNVDKVALVVSFRPCAACTISSSIASGCTVDKPNLASIDPAHGTVAFRDRMSGHIKLTCPMTLPQNIPTGPLTLVVHDWLLASGIPLIRFTGQRHDLTLPVAAQDVGQEVSALNLTISTGNDNLRGGSNPGDNCDVTVQLSSGQSIVLKNVNAGGEWANWTDHTVAIPLPPGGIRGGDIQAVVLHTGFGGGISGDNWNVQQVILQATLATPAPQPLPLLLGMTFYNDHGFDGRVDHCSITADLLRTNLNDIEAGTDIATLTTTGTTDVGRQTVGKEVGPLDFSTSYYWVDIDLFRDTAVATCNPVIVGTHLKTRILTH